MAKATRVLLRVEADGTHVYLKNNKMYRVMPSTGLAGHYAPFRSRAEMYKGRTDPRRTNWFAEAVRERRQLTGTSFRAVKPGPQHM